MKRKNYHEYTLEQFRLNEYDEDRVVGYYDMPIMEPCHYVPERLIGFENMIAAQRRGDFNQGIHFYIFDARFEKLWRFPEVYIPIIKKFQCCIQPDFSTWRDMPIAQQIYNYYRNQLLGQMLQDAGVEVIHQIQFSTPRSYDWCFDGAPIGGVHAVSTQGIARDPVAVELWKAGMEIAINRLKPDQILLYGKAWIDFDFRGIPVKWIKDNRLEGV